MDIGNELILVKSAAETGGQIGNWIRAMAEAGITSK